MANERRIKGLLSDLDRLGNENANQRSKIRDAQTVIDGNYRLMKTTAELVRGYGAEPSAFADAEIGRCEDEIESVPTEQDKG